MTIEVKRKGREREREDSSEYSEERVLNCERMRVMKRREEKNEAFGLVLTKRAWRRRKTVTVTISSF